MEYESLEDIERAYNASILYKSFAFLFGPTRSRVPGLLVHLSNGTVLFDGEISSGKIFGIPMGKERVEKVSLEISVDQISEIALVKKRDALAFTEGRTTTISPITKYRKKRFFLAEDPIIMMVSEETLFFETPEPDTIVEHIQRQNAQKGATTMKAFHAYDIRGIYNEHFTKEDAYKVGFFLPRLLDAKKVLIGRDVRVSSDEIFASLSQGIMDAGADVYDMGLATTPSVYFGTAHFDFDASVQITASHNSKEYNGMKISRKGAKPVGADSGLKDLQRMFENDPVEPVAKKGTLHTIDVLPAYKEYLKERTPDFSNLDISVDCSNGMASLLVKDVLGDAPHYMYDTLDGTFPNHEPNPLVVDNVKDLMEMVKENKSDIGIIYDGDADRVMFVDEKGEYIPADMIVGLLGAYYSAHGATNPTIVMDIRTSRSVAEFLTQKGATPVYWKVGHVFAKQKIAELGAVFGGELAGHYYFQEFFNCDSALLCTLLVLDVVAAQKRKGSTISALIDEIKVYASSGEVNFKIENKAGAMEALYKTYAEEKNPTTVLDFDGYRIEFADWWFNVRPSNTEPYLRLIVEAKDQTLLDTHLEEITKIITSFA